MQGISNQSSRNTELLSSNLDFCKSQAWGICLHTYMSYHVLGILNANRKIRKRTDTDVAFTQEYSRVSIFHRERECTN